MSPTDSRGSASPGRCATAIATAAVLSLLSLLHFIWLWSPWPFETRRDFSRAVLGALTVDLAPSPQATASVALLLATAAWILLARSGCVASRIPLWVLRTASWVIAAVFILRSSVGFLVSGVFTTLLTPEFNALNLALYSPLSLALGSGATFISLARSSARSMNSSSAMSVDELTSGPACQKQPPRI